VNLWIVGENTREDWEFVGVFSSQEKAEAACTNPNCWIGPAVLDEDSGDSSKSVDWPGVYFPSGEVPA
jgi:hypothetical protein